MTKEEIGMSAAQNRLERLERVVELLTKHSQASVARILTKKYSIGLSMARRLIADAKTLMVSRYKPEELDKLKAYITENLVSVLATGGPKEKAAVAKTLCNIYGLNAPIQYEVKTPPLYDGPTPFLTGGDVDVE